MNHPRYFVSSSSSSSPPNFLTKIRSFYFIFLCFCFTGEEVPAPDFFFRRLRCYFNPKKKMNHCGVQNSNFSSREEMRRSSVSVSLSFDDGDTVVCPKPRRLNLFDTTLDEPVRPIRWQMCYQQEPYDSKSGPELLDLIFAKGGGYGASDQTCTQVASSPPYFCGSPPSRVSNPLIQDARFGDAKISPISPRSMIPNPASGMPTPSPSSSARKGGCLRGNYGNKPAVRIEGFDCLDRDNRRNCSIPALA